MGHVAALRSILARHAEATGVAIFLPSVYWDTALFQRPNQLALAMARLGYLTFFCEPPGSSTYSPGFHCLMDSLYLAQVPLVTFRTVPSPVVWALAYHSPDMSYLTRPQVVYEYIDEFDAYPGQRSSLEAAHAEFVRMAAVVVTTADALYEQVRSLRPDVVRGSNGVDYEFIYQAVANTQATPDDLVCLMRPGAPIVGYYGALAEWFDYELLVAAAGARPDWEFVLLGPNLDDSMLSSQIDRRRNVHWLGPRPYRLLPSYLRAFDVATIPFKVSELTHAMSPLKLFEFMAGGKPVVATAMREMQKYPVVLIARDADEYIECLDEALSLRHDSDYRARLDQIARAHSWDTQVRTILAALERTSPRSVGAPEG